MRVGLEDETMNLILQRQYQGTDGRADNGQGGVANPGEKAQSQDADPGDRTGRIRSQRNVRTVPVADSKDCGRGGYQRARSQRPANANDKTCSSCNKAQQCEGPDARDQRSLGHVPEVEAPFDANQQAAGDCSADI